MSDFHITHNIEIREVKITLSLGSLFKPGCPLHQTYCKWALTNRFPRMRNYTSKNFHTHYRIIAHDRETGMRENAYFIKGGNQCMR
jgi:hypothetical protein